MLVIQFDKLAPVRCEGRRVLRKLPVSFAPDAVIVESTVRCPLKDSPCYQDCAALTMVQARDEGSSDEGVVLQCEAGRYILGVVAEPNKEVADA